jgi:hypothetical protein
VSLSTGEPVCLCDTEGYCWTCAEAGGAIGNEVRRDQRAVPVPYVIESDGDMEYGPPRERPQ